MTRWIVVYRLFNRRMHTEHLDQMEVVSFGELEAINIVLEYWRDKHPQTVFQIDTAERIA